MADIVAHVKAAYGHPVTKPLLLTLSGLVLTSIAPQALQPSLVSVLTALGPVINGVGVNLLSTVADTNQALHEGAGSFLHNEQIAGHVGKVAAGLLKRCADEDDFLPEQQTALRALAKCLPDYWLELCREGAPGTFALDGQAFVEYLAGVLARENATPALLQSDWLCVLATAAERRLSATGRPDQAVLEVASDYLATHMGTHLAIALTAPDDDTQRAYQKVVLRFLAGLTRDLASIPTVIAAQGEMLLKLIGTVRELFENNLESQDLWRDIHASLLGLLPKLIQSIEQLRDQVSLLSRPDLTNRSFADIIDQAIRDFIGRGWLFAQIRDFQEGNRQSGGYIHITGLPGQGKTAIAASLAVQYDAARVFCRRDDGGTRTQDLARLIFDQFHTSYQLPHPINAQLEKIGNLLQAVSAARSADKPAFLVIDALDEAPVEALRAGTEDNPLNLPKRLPLGVFVVLTSRDREDCRLREDKLESPLMKVDLSTSSHNRDDASDYILHRLDERESAQYIKRIGATREQISQAILDKSEGNFMYLTHVLPQVQYGILQRTSLEQLPGGLFDFYRLHWEDMKRDASGADLGWKMAMAAVLAVLREGYKESTIYEVVRLMSDAARREHTSISIQPLLAHVQLFDVQSVLQTWRQFLLRQHRDQTARYRIYHLTYSEYLRGEALVKERDLLSVAEEALFGYIATL